MNKLNELIAELRAEWKQVEDGETDNDPSTYWSAYAGNKIADRLQAIVDSMCSVALEACEPAGDSDECGIHWYDARPGAMRRGTFKQPAVEQSGTEPEDYAERHLQMLDQQPSEPTEEAVACINFVFSTSLSNGGFCDSDHILHEGFHFQPAPTEDKQDG